MIVYTSKTTKKKAVAAQFGRPAEKKLAVTPETAKSFKSFTFFLSATQTFFDGFSKQHFPVLLA